MSALDKEIERIVKGMKTNKRSLVKRYGKNAEEVMYAVANKRAKEKLGMNENTNPINLTIPERFANNYKFGKVTMSTNDNFLFIRFHLPEMPGGLRPKNSIWDHEREQAIKQAEFNAKLMEKYFQKVYNIEDSEIATDHKFTQLFMVSDDFLNSPQPEITLNPGNDSINENYMGNQGDKVYIDVKGSHWFKTLPDGDTELVPTPESTLYYIINVDTFDQVDMFFDAEEEAIQYAEKRGLIVVPKPNPSSTFEAKCSCNKLQNIIKEAYKKVSQDYIVDSKSYIESLNESKKNTKK